MKLPTSSTKLKRAKRVLAQSGRHVLGHRLLRPVIFRRVVGFSMAPTLLPGKVVWAHGLYWRLKRDDIVIVMHDGREKIKRIAEIDGQHIYITGDNSALSTDSRHFGWVPKRSIRGKAIGRFRQRLV